jgi:DNA-binding IclR family transcriptional regulator
MLGPAVVTAGQAARRANPLIVRAEQAAEQLFRELETTVYLTTIVGDEILMLRSISDRGPNFVGTRDGQRHPYIAPLGAHLVAWSPESVIDSWIAKAGVDDEQLAQEWRRSIALVRQRGYQITLREPEDASFVDMMAAMAKGPQAHRYKDHALSYLSTHHPHFRQPETLVADTLYEVNVLAAPIFSHDRGTHLSLCLAGFRDKLTGAQVTNYADHLLRTCLRVMQENQIF